MRRQTVLGLTIGLILVVAISGLGMYHYSQVNPDDVKKDFEARIAELHRMPDADAARKDKAAGELLANPLYKEHAKALWLKLDRERRSLHDAAELELRSEKDVKDFLARSKASGGDPYTLEAEARSLITRYGFTRWGGVLREEQQRLQAIVDANRGPQPRDYIALTGDVLKAAQEGHYAPAMAMIADFEKRFPNHKDYDAKLADLKDQVQRRVLPAAMKILEKTQVGTALNRPAAIQLLEKSLPDFEGFTEKALLEARLRELRKP